MIIPCQRHLFDIPEDVAYLNCAYVAPLMHEVVTAGEVGARRKARPWELLPPDFFDQAEEARGLFAELVGATAEDVAILPSTSYGLAIAASNLPVEPGQKLVGLHEQFPSNYYTWRELARERGAEFVVLPRPDDDDWTAAVLAAIDDRTAIVALPHCHWTDGALVDLVRIGEACREVGAALCVDATQSLGAMPLDVREVQPDYLVAATYKWLLGPYAMGFAYVAPRHQDGRPMEQHWSIRANSQDFERLVDYRDGYQPGARRFDVGEKENFHVVPMAIPALRKLLEWGSDNIQETLRAMTDLIAERAAEMQIGAVPRDRRAGHYLGLRFTGGVPEGLAARLAAERVYVSVRGRDSMRITPNLWVNDADIDRFFAVLEDSM